MDIKPDEVKLDAAIQAERPDNRPWGMPTEDFIRFLTLMAMGMERLDRRQRWVMLKQVKTIRKELNVRWPFGRPIGDIQAEIAAQKTGTKIIIPTGVNVDSLKEKP